MAKNTNTNTATAPAKATTRKRAAKATTAKATNAAKANDAKAAEATATAEPKAKEPSTTMQAQAAALKALEAGADYATLRNTAGALLRDNRGSTTAEHFAERYSPTGPFAKVAGFLLGERTDKVLGAPGSKQCRSSLHVFARAGDVAMYDALNIKHKDGVPATTGEVTDSKGNAIKAQCPRCGAIVGLWLQRDGIVALRHHNTAKRAPKATGTYYVSTEDARMTYGRRWDLSTPASRAAAEAKAAK